MSIDLKKIMKSKALNGWRLFWLVSVPISIVIANAMMRTDLSTGEGVSHMISYSVRFAIPFIFMVVAASSVQILFPGPIPMWWLRNRKYIGLCFAVAMAWQGLFIFIVSTFLRDYYFEEIYYFRDELEGTIGYLFLAAMVVTSFRFGRKTISSKQWKLVHKGGIYFLWAYPFSVYWWNLSYYPSVEPFSDPRMIDYIFYWMGFIAFALRIAAWGKTRLQAARKTAPEGTTPRAFKLLGSGLIVFGLVASATGLHWQEPVTALLTGTKVSAELVLWLPYWPLEPYLSLFAIGLGTLLVTAVRSQSEAGVEVAGLTD
jgi:DMSO/TMAO reductase YedYZ heme-binding membrane subunit